MSFSRFNRIPIAWLLVMPVLLLLPAMFSFPYPAGGAAFSDLVITHYPNAIFLRQSILVSGEIPFWSTSILSGYPFAANPLSGLWYPPGWFALLLPLPFGFNLMIALHLIIGGYGLYRLMREEGLGQQPALVAGLSFALLPKLFAHYGAGHLTLLYAIPLTPWLLFFQRRARNGNSRFRIPPGLILALIILADVRWGAFAILFWWAYAVFHNNTGWRKLFSRLLIQTGLALLLAAPLLIPLLEFSRLSTRSLLTASDVLTFSLPVMNLLGLLFPNPATNHEWVLYGSGVVVLLAFAGLITRKSNKNEYFWGLTILLGILIALGGQIPGAGVISILPLVSWLRVPSRALFLTGIGIASLAGYGADAILKKSPVKRAKVFTLLLFSCILFSIFLSGGLYLVSEEFPVELFWGTISIITGAVWIWAGIREIVPGKVWIAGVLLILVIDLSYFDSKVFVSKSVDDVLGEREGVAEFIHSQGENGRTYSPSYSIPQQTAIRYGLHLTDGVDPLQIASYAEFMDQASGVPRDGYSVTLPPFASGKPATDNKNYSPDAGKLGILNVGYVVSDFQLKVPELTEVKSIDGVIIYQNEKKRSPAWVQSGILTNPQEIRPAEVVQRSANKMQISATGPGTLVVSEVMYPGWRLEVDGKPAELSRLYTVLMSTALESGKHEILLQFQPASVYLGLILCGLGILVMVGMIWMKWE
ncbi:MAG: hypothetical protein ACK2UE_16075 [Anaerolineales bacterium]